MKFPVLLLSFQKPVDQLWYTGYMKSVVLNYAILLQKEPEGGYTVTVPTLPGVVTYGENIEEAKKMAIEAIELYLESLNNHKEELPKEHEIFYTHVSINSSFHHA